MDEKGGRVMIRVVQLGARMHYAVPRILADVGALEALYTDIYAGEGWDRLARWVSKGGRVTRLLDRRGPGIPPSRVVPHSAFGLLYHAKLAMAKSPESKDLANLWAGKRFATLAARDIRSAQGVYAFNSAALELFAAARERGIQTTLELTIAPRRTEVEMLRIGAERWPLWKPSVSTLSSLWVEREREEWMLADRLICASSFVRDSLRLCGGPVNRCEIVPYGVDLPRLTSPRRLKNRPLRILTAGALSLRKGAPCVFDVARRLAGFHFRWVGAGAPPAGERVPSNIVVHRAVPRSEMAEHYQWADVFLLPSLCEGSATVVYEALGHGLPVICTPNSGSVMRDGVEGFLVPPFDSRAVEHALLALADSSDVLESFSFAARARGEQFDLAAYSHNLRRALGLHTEASVAC